MLICLSGRKRSGKDMSAEALVKELGFERIALADKVKEFTARLLWQLPEVKSFFRWKGTIAVPQESSIDEFVTWVSSDEFKSAVIADLAGRQWLQAVGTEAGRATFGDDFWVVQLLQTLDPKVDYVCSDVRYPNELAGLMRSFRSSYSIRLNRADRKDKHDFSAHPDGNCGYCRSSSSSCGLPKFMHPTHDSGDFHPSETSMPDESNDTVRYDAVFESASGEEAAAHVLTQVKLWRGR